jgi:hypothetical protein
MSAAISRDDAITAVRLWGLASYRYSAAVRLDVPDELYAGLASDGDPVVALEDLAAQIAQLANSWRRWFEQVESEWGASP